MKAINYLIFSFLIFMSVMVGCKKKKKISPSIPTNGLIAYYPFEGNTNDLSGNKNDGQAINSPQLTSDRNNIQNSAYLFNGNNQYIMIPDSPTLKNLSSGVTVTAWVKVNGWFGNWQDGAWASVVCKSEGQNPNFQLQVLYYKVQGKKYYLHSDGVIPGVDTGKEIELGSWFHVAMTIDGANRGYYFNGNFVGSVNNFPILKPNNVPLYIGRDPYSDDEYHNGAIDDVTIYNRSLSADEIKTIFNASK